MELENIVSELSGKFIDSKNTSYRLDSIGYLISTLKGGKLRGQKLKTQLEKVAAISLSFGYNQLEALKVIEKVYADAVRKRLSTLHQLSTEELTDSEHPFNEIETRVTAYRESEGKNITLTGLKNILIEELIGHITEGHRPPAYGTGLEYAQRVRLGKKSS